MLCCFGFVIFDEDGTHKMNLEQNYSINNGKIYHKFEAFELQTASSDTAFCEQTSYTATAGPVAL